MFKEDINHKPEGIKGTMHPNKCKTSHTDQETDRSLGLSPDKLEGLNIQDPHSPNRALKPLDIGHQTVTINSRA